MNSGTKLMSVDTIYGLGPAILRLKIRPYALYLGPPRRWRRFRASAHQAAEVHRDIR